MASPMGQAPMGQNDRTAGVCAPIRREKGNPVRITGDDGCTFPDCFARGSLFSRPHRRESFARRGRDL